MALRVVHVITRLSLGGSSENTVLSIAGLIAAGHECLLVAGETQSEPAVVEAARARGCGVELIPSLVRQPSPVRDLAALVALVRLFRRRRPDLVHTHTSKAGFIGRLAARIARVPIVAHTPHGHVFYAYHGAATTAAFVWLERIAARWTDRIVVLTERGAGEHLARGIGRASQYVAIPSGVDTAALSARAPERAAARLALGLPPDAAVVVGVGRLVPVKGFDVLVAALPKVRAAVPSLRVLLVGDGPERPAIESLARTLGVADSLTITGAQADVVPYLAAADVLAAPSRNEGMGRVLIEAMALGVPVVATRVGGIPAVLAGGEFGPLVEPDTPGALAEALIGLLGDPAGREKLAEAGRRRAEDFTEAVMVSRMVRLYRELAEASFLGGGLRPPSEPPPGMAPAKPALERRGRARETRGIE
jgi:glycosyltransferase involved in cell wall biosynthesis